MTTPVVQEPQLVIPFVQVPAFKAHPTYLDLANLRSGDSVLADQDDELNNILLMASADVERFINQPVQAHVQTDQARMRSDKYGRLHLYPTHSPARSLLSYTYTSTLNGTATSIGTPNFFIEEGRMITVELNGSNISWSGPLQFGAPPATVEMYVTYTYVAAWANALLTNNPIQGATSISLSNVTGIFPGDVLRIWEPGVEESVTVASTYVPVNTSPPSAGTVQLAAGMAKAHTANAGVTGFNNDIFLGTIYYAIDLLQRWGSASSKWPNGKKTATGGDGGEMSVWEEKAERRLLKYRRVR